MEIWALILGVKEKILLETCHSKTKMDKEETLKVSIIIKFINSSILAKGMAGMLPAQGGTHRKSNSTANNQMALKNQMGGFSGATGNNMKFVKPSELNLDFINPNSN
jgi:hypothetical protein|tara:strand:+ start:509 stop:829 length:321 start_codon:yes stop_codon:yes gene_type:complete